MGGCRCTFKDCTSVTTPDKNLHFFHYPVKLPDVCNQWMKNAEKPHFTKLDEKQLKNRVVCEYHFEEKCFFNTLKKRIVQGSVPTLDGPCQAPKSKDSELPESKPLPPRKPVPAPSKVNYSKHRMLKNGCSIESFQCGSCSFKTKWESVLERHVKMKHDIASDWIACPYPACEYFTKLRSNLKMHNILKHKNTCIYQCAFCEHVAMTEDDLKLHVEENHHIQCSTINDQNAEMTFKCEITTEFETIKEEIQ